LIYWIGFCIVLLFILFSLDDIAWDFVVIIKKYFQKDTNKIPLEALDNEIPQLLAIIIAAWHEDNVIGDVIRNLIESTQYPRSMYHIFIGVYPNDEKTINVVKELSEEFPNVHGIINNKPGPTSKAQNINYVITQIRQFEDEKGWIFSSFTIHDSEDVVHPNELKMTNYLIRRHEALQFAVFPLQEMPKLSNIFPNMTTGTYADEFAENHFHTMVARSRTDSVVPSAGTGFALSRELVAETDFEDILPENSLTEDYKLSFLLIQRGHRLHYVLETVERLDNRGKIVSEFIATRSRFPATFKTAVKQKTRWIYGITMQSIHFKEIWSKKNNFNFQQRYSLFRDWKAKFSNLLVLPGYLIFIYFLLSLILPLQPMYPVGSVSWYFCIVLTVMMFERQFMRTVAIENIYGWKSAIIACFLPPILPFRMVWGNLINFTATVKAWQMYFKGTTNKKEKSRKGGKTWVKTDHDFLEKDVLKRFHRNLGDLLLENKMISPEDLKLALIKSHEENKRIGSVLKEEGKLSEEFLLRELAAVKHTLYVPLQSLQVGPRLDHFNIELLKELFACPIIETDDSLIIAISDISPIDVQDRLEKISRKKVEIVYSTLNDIQTALAEPVKRINLKNSDIENCVSEGYLTAEQALLTLIYHEKSLKPINEVLQEMGLLSAANRLWNTQSYYGKFKKTFRMLF